MKNEQEIKALFFAQYLGQKCNYINRLGEKQDGCIINGFIIDEIANWITRFNDDPYTILLRGVNQLTDDEVILCGQIGFDFFNCIGCEYKLKVIRELTKISLVAISIDEKTCLVKIEINNVWKLNISQIDYLRSIGILLPLTFIDKTGHPQTLSTADIIARKWAQIVTT